MDDVVGRAQELIRTNQYLTLATAGATGTPWSSTVWYAAWHRTPSLHGLAVELIWLSRPEARHSRNLLERAEVGISIFDSRQPAGTGDGLQLAAHAAPVPSDRLDDAAAVFSEASLAAGGGSWSRAQVEPPAASRLYVAHLTAAYLLGSGSRVDVPLG